MDNINNLILAALSEFSQPVSVVFLHEKISQKVSISFPSFEVRIADLNRQGYLHIQQVGRRSVLVSLTRDRPGAAEMQGARVPVLKLVARKSWQAVLIGFLVGGILAISLCGALVFIGWQVWSGNLLIPGLKPTEKSLAPTTAIASPQAQLPLSGLIQPSPTGTQAPSGIPVPDPTATLIPAPLLTLTPVPVIQNLVQVSGAGDLSDLNVSVSILIPLVDPVQSAADEGFNQIVQAYTNDDLERDREWLDGPLPDPGGFVKVDYAVVSGLDWLPGEHFPYLIDSASSMRLDDATLDAGHNVLSVLFTRMGYFGGAHPGTSYETINYDFSTGQRLALGDLFLPETSYLNTIASYCMDDLPRRYDDLSLDGASPSPENYRSWAVTRLGLVVIFGEYQLASYAAGPQYVIIPYPVLEDLIDPLGPAGLHAR